MLPCIPAPYYSKLAPYYTHWLTTKPAPSRAGSLPNWLPNRLAPYQTGSLPIWLPPELAPLLNWLPPYKSGCPLTPPPRTHTPPCPAATPMPPAPRYPPPTWTATPPACTEEPKCGCRTGCLTWSRWRPTLSRTCTPTPTPTPASAWSTRIHPMAATPSRTRSCTCTCTHTCMCTRTCTCTPPSASLAPRGPAIRHLTRPPPVPHARPTSTPRPPAPSRYCRRSHRSPTSPWLQRWAAGSHASQTRRARTCRALSRPPARPPASGTIP